MWNCEYLKNWCMFDFWNKMYKKQNNQACNAHWRPRTHTKMKKSLVNWPTQTMSNNKQLWTFFKQLNWLSKVDITVQINFIDWIVCDFSIETCEWFIMYYWKRAELELQPHIQIIIDQLFACVLYSWINRISHIYIPLILNITNKTNQNG